jgi:hypothetical protein
MIVFFLKIQKKHSEFLIGTVPDGLNMCLVNLFQSTIHGFQPQWI